MCSDISGHKFWRSDTFAEKPQSSLSAMDHRQVLSGQHRAVLARFLGFRNPPHTCAEEYAIPPDIHQMSGL